MGTTKVQTASYEVEVSVTCDGEAVGVQTEDTAHIVDISSGKEYRFTVEPTGTANKGYCIVNFNGIDYYTEQLTSDSASLIFKVYANGDGKVTITPHWGEYEYTSVPEDRILKPDSELGTKIEPTVENSDPILSEIEPTVSDDAE